MDGFSEASVTNPGFSPDQSCFVSKSPKFYLHLCEEVKRQCSPGLTLSLVFVLATFYLNWIRDEREAKKVFLSCDWSVVMNPNRLLVD